MNTEEPVTKGNNGCNLHNTHTEAACKTKQNAETIVSTVCDYVFHEKIDSMVPFNNLSNIHSKQLSKG